MHSLFALGLFVSGSAFAAGSISTSLSQESTFEIANQETKKSSQAVVIQTADLLNHLLITGQVSNEVQDVSHKTLTLRSGQTAPLIQIDDGIRRIFLATAEYQADSVITSVSTAQDIKPSAFSRRYEGILIQKNFYSGATQVSAGYETSNQSQPESYFINPSTLQTQKRLGTISNNTVTIGLEQILTENLRSKIQYSESKFENFRPLQKFFRLASSAAISSRWTFRNDLGISSENRNENLYDDRGYFEAQWMENQISYEWQLDSFVGLGWSTVLEKEEDPRRGYVGSLGTDTFGIFIDKKFKKFTVTTKAGQTQTSEAQSGFSVAGELKWDL